MNVQRINELADHLEKNIPDDGFDMDNYFIEMPRLANNYCGTPSCIAGYAIDLFGSKHRIEISVCSSGRNIWPKQYAAELLELDGPIMAELFTPECGLQENITRENAVDALRTLADTGTFYWDNILGG